MTTPTSKPVPSSSVVDLLFNAERLDEIVNAVASMYIDRFGVPRLTAQGAVDSIKSITARGAWVASTAYASKDVVQVSGTWYIAVEPHVSSTTFAADSAKWRVYQGVLFADLAAPGASSAIGFQQEGEGSASRTVQDKLREGAYDLRDAGPVDATGATEATTVFLLAATLAAMQGRALRLPAGTLLLDAVVLPTMLPALIGAGERATTLRFKRRTAPNPYPPGTVLLNASNNTAGLHLADFTVDCDDPVFFNAGTYGIVLNASHRIRVNRVTVTGRGAAGIYTNAMTNGRVTDVTVNAVGGALASFHAAFQGAACVDVIVQGLRTTGLPTYSGVFQAGTRFSQFAFCHTEGTGGPGFGYSLGGCAYSHILGCTAKNTNHEAFQISDSYYCSIDGNTCEWESGYGIDMGISINGGVGSSGQTRFNRVTNNTVVNSYAAAIGVANNAQNNLVEGNKGRDCGVRGTAASGTGAAYCSLVQYTDLGGVACTSNTFRDNDVAAESGPVNFHYGEFNLGAGSSLSGGRLIDNLLSGTATGGRYSLLNARVWELEGQTVPLTLTAATGGAITAYTASMTYRYRGTSIQIQRVAINITNAGSAAGALTALWAGAPASAMDGGTVCGQDKTSQQGVMGICSGGGFVVSRAGGATSIATGANIVLAGEYMLA